jgi:hypothetical protein
VQFGDKRVEHFTFEHEIVPEIGENAAFDRCRQRGAGAGDAALDRTDCHTADIGHFFVADMAHCRQDQHFALRRGQRCQRAQHVGGFHPALLRRRRVEQALRLDLVIIADKPHAPALAEIDVAQNGERPCVEARPGDKMFARGPGLEQGFLRQVIGHFATAAQRPGKGAQMGNRGRQFFVKLRIGQRRTLRSAGFLIAFAKRGHDMLSVH